MEEYEQVWQAVRKVRDRGWLVLVEGKKDKRALEECGLSNIKTLDKPLYAIVEEVAASEKEVVVLTDLDKEGRKLYARLASDLQQRGVTIHNELRELLFRTKLRQIEGLQTYLRNRR